ncbi:hypothetical protein BDZ89DRAFT_1137613 [Hymenopellis radicata]|nr:hypothetical protein BDZ89DRAFT_1137613 [Hymenopellis radicata]
MPTQVRLTLDAISEPVCKPLCSTSYQYVILPGGNVEPMCRHLPGMVEHLLGPVSRRIQSLHLFIDVPLIRGLHPLRKSFHAMKELYINVNNAFRSDPSDELSDLFVETPNLTLYETRNVADPSSFGIPWHQIKCCGPSVSWFPSEISEFFPLQVTYRKPHFVI